MRSIVVVPAPGQARPLEWTLTSSTPPVHWLQNLLNDFTKRPGSIATIREHCYDPVNDVDEPSLVTYLKQEGDELVKLLRRHCSETDMVEKRRPLVLVCHGTGGIVVKRVSGTDALFLGFSSSKP